MSWLKFETHTPEKPEVMAITVAMGWDDPDLTVGKLLKVWRWFDTHTVDGNAKSVTLTLLDKLIGVSGLTQAMVNVGWLCVTEDGLSLPNFTNHNGETAKNRALTAKRVAKHKVVRKTNDSGVTSALPREEKRREEKNISTNVDIKDTHTVITPAGVVCRHLRDLGFSDAHAGHQGLKDLLPENLPPDFDLTEWTFAASKAQSAGKGFGYLLGVVKGARADAAKQPAQAVTAHTGFSQRNYGEGIQDL